MEGWQTPEEHAAHHARQACFHVEQACELKDDQPATAMLEAQIAAGHGLASLAIMASNAGPGEE